MDVRTKELAREASRLLAQSRCHVQAAAEIIAESAAALLKTAKKK